MLLRSVPEMALHKTDSSAKVIPRMYSTIKKFVAARVGNGKPSHQHNVVIADSNHNYVAKGKATILTAAVNAGIAFPHSCGEGFCGTCKCKVITGKYELTGNIEHLVSEEEQRAGYVLACKTRPMSDIVISLKNGALSGAAVVRDVIELSKSVVNLRIELSQPLAYHGGQFINLKPDMMADPRPYSIVTPNDGPANVLDFHVSTKGSGEFATWVKQQAQPGQKIEWDGPHGTFNLKADARDIVLVAGGSGAGVLWGMVASLSDANITVLAVTNRDGNFYFRDQFLQLGEKNKIDVIGVPYMPNLADGYSALAQQASVLATQKNMPPLFLLCGSLQLVRSVTAALLHAGVDAASIVSDAFIERPMNEQSSQSAIN